MKKIILMLTIIISSQFVFGQVHWLVNADSIPECSFIKEGKFINKETPDKATEGYYIIIKDGYSTEYINNGEYYVKSKMNFTGDCAYTSTVEEVTIPNYSVRPGTQIQTEIVETALTDNLIEIKATMNGKSSFLVLEKVK
jgi:hypothetical protein